jgi:hypothetical protein
VVGKGNGFAVVGTHALGVGLQRALGAHLPCAALICAHRMTSMHLMVYVLAIGGQPAADA